MTELSETSVSVIFESETWGKLVIPEATVSETDGGYGITGEGSAIMGMGDKTGEYPCTLKATINRNRDFSFEYSIPSVMGGLTVTIMSGNIPSKVMPVKLDTYENPHEYV